MSFSIYDVIIAGILLYTTIQGFRKGFVLTLCDFLDVFVALIGAVILSSILTGPISEAVQPMVQSGIQTYLDKALAANQTGIAAMLEALSDSALYRGFVSALEDQLGSQIGLTTTAIVSMMAAHISFQFTRGIVFVLSFAIIYAVWKMLSRVLDLACKLPVLNTLNGLAGGAAGLAKGALIVFMAAWLLKIQFLTPADIENSVLLRFFCTVNPLTWLK